MQKIKYIEEVTKKFEGKYDYSKLDYKGVHIKSIIVCPTHGDQYLTPNEHRKMGCKHCNRDKEIVDITTKFIKEASQIHSNKYSYSKVNYTSNRTPVVITCPTHGDFKQTTTNHLKGHGCRKCQYATNSLNFKKPLDVFIKESSIVHNNKYDYTKTLYANSNSKVVITCPIHGDFTQYAGHHVRGVGCNKCSPSGFNKSKPGILYYLSINEGEAYKIGITNLSVTERYSNSELSKIKIIETVSYLTGEDAYKKEQEILNKYKEYRYTEKRLLNSGNTELFSVDLFLLKENNEINSIREL